MTTTQPANDNEDGLLLIEDDPSSFLDPEGLDELTSDLRIGRRIFIASSTCPSHAARFLARGYSVVVSKNGLTDALPDVSARLATAGRVFASARLAGAVAERLRDDQKISALARCTDKLAADVRARLSSTLYLDSVSAPLPQGLRS